MKRILLIVVLFICIILINNKDEINEEEEVRGIFISYIELSKYIRKDNEKVSKNNIKKMVKNIKEYNLNTIILQVVISSDAIYDSKVYPYSMYVSKNEGEDYYDVLEYFIKEAHRNNIKLYAWINPYRVRTTQDVSSISYKNPAYKYLGTDTIYQKNGIFYNPSKREVNDLIISGVKEVLNYEIDALLFDDYFYPSDDIDIKDYNEYKEHNNISMKDYHLQVVNNLVKKVYKECRRKNIKFGISPDGNIDNNYNKNYADVKRWLSSSNYVDFIMPQIYYGFYNEAKSYKKTIHEWENLIKNKDIDLHIALAFYKVGIEDKYAKEGSREWIDYDNIIMREVIIARGLKNYSGFSLFRYDNLFDKNSYTKTSKNEVNNLKKVLNEIN